MPYDRSRSAVAVCSPERQAVQDLLLAFEVRLVEVGAAEIKSIAESDPG